MIERRCREKLANFPGASKKREKIQRAFRAPGSKEEKQEERGLSHSSNVREKRKKKKMFKKVAHR